MAGGWEGEEEQGVEALNVMIGGATFLDVYIFVWIPLIYGLWYRVPCAK